MARPTRITPGAPCWVDLSTSDQARAREFYGAVFGSQFNLLQETAAMPLVPAGEQTPAGVSQ